MEALLTLENRHLEIDLPEEFVGKRIKVTVLPVEEDKPEASKKTMADFVGFMSDKTANEIRKNIEEGWE